MTANRRPATAAPLWVWALALAGVALVLYASLDDYLDTTVTRPAADTHAHVLRIEEFAREVADDPSKIDIIALGDSALRNATYFDEEMAEFSRRIGGPEIRFLRITHAKASIHDHLGVLDAAIAARPDLLLIQAWIIPQRSSAAERERHAAYRAGDPVEFNVSRERHRQNLFAGKSMLQHQSYLANRLLHLLGDWVDPEVGVGNRYARRQRQLLCFRRNPRIVIKRHKRRFDVANRLDADSKASIDLLLQRAAEAGVTVAFFDLPQANDLARLPGVAHKLAEQTRFLRSLGDRPALQYWSVDTPLGDDAFCDPVHMTRSGRDTFATWLLERIAAVSESGSTP